jgi:hypothetical protein
LETVTIELRQEPLKAVIVKTGCCWDFYRTIRRNSSCVIYFSILIIIVTTLVLRPKEQPFFENKDYNPVPEDFSKIDEFIN